MNAPATTCQICGRPTKPVFGYPKLGAGLHLSTTLDRAPIAHHGYTRPGGCWGQTASCFGARWRPYEVACDALPPAIASCEKWVGDLVAAYESDRTNPPATLECNTQRGSFGRPNYVTLTRPDGYDGTADSGSWTPRTYDGVFKSMQAERQRYISTGRNSLAHMRKRLSEWKAPTETKVTT